MTISSFYEYLVYEERTSSNPVPSFRKRYLTANKNNQPSESRKLISVEEITLLINSTLEIRDKARLKALYSKSNEISNNRFLALNRVLAILKEPISPVEEVCTLLQAFTFQPSITHMLSSVMLSGKGNLS